LIRATLSLCGFFALFAAGCAETLPSVQGPRDDVPIDYTLPTLRGGVVDLARLRGNVVLLDVFATWSVDSTAEVPTLRALLGSYEGRGLSMVSIAFDSGVPTLVRTFAETLGISWTVALATPELVEGRSPLGPIPGVPRTLLLDRRGYVRFTHVGKTPAKQLAKEIESLL
jgi:hypothetical protein